jgi:hypothetical protein
MSTSMAEGPVHQLELVPLGEGAWRLCDRNLDEDDPASVVAYVEAGTEGFDVVWLQRFGGRSRFSTLGDVLLAAIDGSSSISAGHRPYRIPHLPPRPQWG